MLKDLTVATLLCEQDIYLLDGWLDNHDGIGANIIVSLDMFCDIKEKEYNDKILKSQLTWETNPIQNDFAAARNKVLKAAKTEWVLFLDADELLHPLSKQALENTFLKDLYSDFYYIYRLNLFNRRFVHPNNYHAALINKKRTKYINMSPEQGASPGCHEKPDGNGQLLDPKLFQILHIKNYNN